MHPFARSLILVLVALMISGGLLALSLLGENSGLSVVQLLASGAIAAIAGIFLFVQGWRWSQRAWNGGSSGASVAMAFAGGIGGILGAVALAGVVILLLLFYVN